MTGHRPALRGLARSGRGTRPGPGVDSASLRWARRFGKPLLMPALGARLLGGPRSPGFRRVLLAQVFSWGGDLALNGRTRGCFLAGLGSFLAAHVAYISAYRSRSTAPVAGTPGRRTILASGGAASAGVGLLAGRTDRTLAAPVTAYGITLSTMVAAAAAIDAEQGRRRVLAGAVLFMASDGLIAVRRFVAHDRGDLLGLAVMATYVGAQWCITEGMSGRPDLPRAVLSAGRPGIRVGVGAGLV